MAAPKKRKKFTRWIALLVAIVSVYAIVVFIQQQVQIREQKTQIAQAQDKLNGLKEQNDALSQQTEDARSDENVEKIARDKLNMVKEGEILFTEAPKQ
jgi:cell division protein FtsL